MTAYAFQYPAGSVLLLLTWAIQKTKITMAMKIIAATETTLAA
jgi:hypothetical protein